MTGSPRLLKLRGLFQRIVADEGFQLRPEKTKTELAHQRQTVTNFVVNTKVNLTRENRAAIKKEVKTAHGLGGELSPSTAGKMFWLRAVNPEVGKRLVKTVLRAIVILSLAAYGRANTAWSTIWVYFRQETRYGTATAGLPRRGFSEPGRMPVRLAKSSGPIRRSFDTSDLGPIYDGARTAV